MFGNNFYFLFSKSCLGEYKAKTIFLYFQKVISIDFWKLEIQNSFLHCRDSNDPKMVLGSHVRGPNNIICRAWVWKGRPWSPDSGLGGSGHWPSSEEFMELRTLIILLFLGLHGLGDGLFPPPSVLLLFPFYTSIYPLSSVHM